MTLIYVTQSDGLEPIGTTVINLSHVLWMERRSNSYTRIYFGMGEESADSGDNFDYINVDESPEEILELIENANP